MSAPKVKPQPKVYLSAREKALNRLNDAPRHVDAAVCKAFEEADAECDRLKARVAELEAQLETMPSSMRSLINGAVAKEREACARLAEKSFPGEDRDLWGSEIADAIRARGIP